MDNALQNGCICKGKAIEFRAAGSAASHISHCFYGSADASKPLFSAAVNMRGRNVALKKRVVSLCIFALLLASPSLAAPVSSAPEGPQFYVSTTGNDANSGTSLSAPWRTIQKALNSATPGSTVNITAGTYNERLTLGVSGTAGHYITFQPYNFSVPASGCGGYTGVACGGDQVILDYS